jgi:hypothetical protein
MNRKGMRIIETPDLPVLAVSCARMKRNDPSTSRGPAVLFVLVGWARAYDGETRIDGYHKYLRQGNGDDCSEMSMYIKEDDGYFRCGIGRGQIKKVGQLDVVFVARSPEADYRIVAVYYDVQCYPSTDDDSYWWAQTSKCLPFRGTRRQRCDGPAVKACADGPSGWGQLDESI